MSCMGQNDQNGRIGFSAFSTAILQRRFLTLHRQEYVDINRRGTREEIKNIIGLKSNLSSQ